MRWFEGGVQYGLVAGAVDPPREVAVYASRNRGYDVEEGKLFMKIVILSVGRVRQSFVLQGEGEYLQRIKGSFSVELVELGMDSPESMSPGEVQALEAEALLKKISTYDYVIALDERGKGVTSHQLSDAIQARMNAGNKTVCFIIGGAFGLSEKIRQEADSVLSLSALTFPHQVTRLILVEQLYRAHTLMRGISYHK